MIIDTKYSVKQLAAGSQCRSGVDKEKDADDHGGYTQQNLLLVLVAIAEEFRKGQ